MGIRDFKSSSSVKLVNFNTKSYGISIEEVQCTANWVWQANVNRPSKNIIFIELE
jgi:hypothetical protein